MRNFLKYSALLLAVLGLLVAPAWAQDEEDDQATLTLKDVKQRLAENQKHLNMAKTRGKAGDAPGMEIALQNFSRGTEGINRALEQGRFNGTEYEREEAFDRVEKATRKHTEVLTDLLENEKVPEQARPAIEHAREVSQHGRTTALENLARVREQRAAEARATGRPSGAGRPDSAGRPGGIGGAPSSRPGGGPPAGVPKGGRP